MGNKAGYAEVILAALGLGSGQGAERYLWAEADDDVAALLRCYPDASMLRRVAEIIRGWQDEEPRALWERLRAERKARGPRDEAEQTAEFLQVVARTTPMGDGYKSPEHGTGNWESPTGLSDACHRLAEYAAIVSSNRLISVAGPDLMNTGNGGTTFGGEFATPVEDVAAAFERVAGEVASFEVSSSWSYEQGNTRTDFVGPGDRRQDTTATATATARLAVGGWPPVLVLPRIPEAADVAAWMRTPGDLEDCVVYMDPPYAGTTGYAATLSRDQVVRHARAYAELGAVVAISEAEVVIAEWDAVEITAGRRGQKRTFSKQQAEWLTMNRAPAHRVAVQAGLFAVGA
jgi:hypothetical protein